MNSMSNQFSVRDLHNEAMRYAHLARIARHEGNNAQALHLARLGAQLEAQAATQVPPGPEAEPTRSILFRSAASLAFQAEEYLMARQLVAHGLSGQPNSKVEKELLALFDDIKLQINLHANNQALEDVDVRLSLQGEAVGAGFILYNELKSRIDVFFTLVTRTVQRKMLRTYQPRGKAAGLYKPFKPGVSVGETGSYIMTLRLMKDEQYVQPLLGVTASQVIDEVMQGLSLIENSNESNLRELIPDESYYDNFVYLTKNLAPDGSQISAVGFTSRNRAVGLTRTRVEIETTPRIDPEEARGIQEHVDFIGVLDKADDQDSKGVIGITTENGGHYQIRISAGIDDVVSMNWKKQVRVIGSKIGGYVYSSDIQPLE